MKKIHFLAALLLFSVSGFYCNAQYGQKLQPGVNAELNVNPFNPKGSETLYTVDSSIINQMDFGQKSNKKSFKIVFAFKSVDIRSKSLFSFKKSDIQGTHITKNSGISYIELTREGFEITYKTKNKMGPVDDYIVIDTFNGRFLLRLTGEIVASDKE